MTRIGTRLVRVEPQGDDWDAIKVVGVFDMGEVGSELTVTPADTFGPVVSVDPTSLNDYKRETVEDAAMAALVARLDNWEVKT